MKEDTPLHFAKALLYSPAKKRAEPFALIQASTLSQRKRAQRRLSHFRPR